MCINISAVAFKLHVTPVTCYLPFPTKFVIIKYIYMVKICVSHKDVYKNVKIADNYWIVSLR